MGDVTAAELLVRQLRHHALSTQRLGVLAMAALAYIPALLSSPGKMPADTKLYLYLNPRQLVADSIWTFDGRQFAGWVPHQMIAYVWPSGSWYVAAQAIGLPDWVAHRLWIGTIMFAAGTGVVWAARRLGSGRCPGVASGRCPGVASGRCPGVAGLSIPAALAAGLIYQLSPYLVPYISRTSSMLLPWAALGWIVGLTVGAATRTRWRDAAICALVIGSVCGVNTTATIMIAPAPILWLAVAVLERTVTLPRALAAAARIGGLSLATSAWWIMMQLIQGREGADLLAYSESLEDVSLTATSGEAWRSLGYWLMYIRDPYAPTTTAGRDYMTDVRTIVSGFVIVVVALVGLAVTRFAARRFAIAMTFVGLVLAVGVHPFSHPSPIARLVRGDGQEGLSLALRSSTRALPLMTLGLGLGAAALIDALGRRVEWRRVVLAAAVVIVAVASLPVLTDTELVDAALEREEQAPDAWHEAAATLDELPPGYRVLQLPGAEFGAFTWGYTVDPPLPALTDRPLVSRDLLPLGSPAAMDVVYALDDRFQTGRPELESVAPIARLLGVDTIWLTGDAAFDRFRTPRPELMSQLFNQPGNAEIGLGDPSSYGEPVINAPRVPMVDEQSLAEESVGSPIAPVELVPVLEPVAIVRASGDEVLLSGNGDGLVDAAAGGLIDGTEAIRYSASMSADELAEAAERAGMLIVTDSNRQRAHHWRSSQDVTGFTEEAGGPSTLWDDSGDARLPLFPDAGADAYTVSLQDGPVAAAVSSYGERFSYQPEDRAAMAIDGDPNTAWTVLEHTFQYIELTTESGVDHVTLLQPHGLDDVRHLREVRIRVNGGAPIDVELDDRSFVTGQRVPLPATDGPTTIRIELRSVAPATADSDAPDRTPVGFAEIDTGLGPSPEVIVVPTDLTAAMREAGIDRPVTFVLTRERVRATNRWRSDPEWRIARLIDVPFDQEVGVDVSVRVDQRASDAVLASLLGIDGPVASARLTGVPSSGGWAAADGDSESAWVTPFGTAVGASLSVELMDPGEPVTLEQRPGNYSVVTAVRLHQADRSADVAVSSPDRSGRSSFEIPDGFEAGQVRIEILDVDERTTRDRHFGENVVMPVAISEISNVAMASMPEHFETECRDDLMSIDGEAISVRVSGSVADAFAGNELDAVVCDRQPLRLTAGEHRVTGQESRRIGLQVDRIVLDAGAPDAVSDDSGPVATVVDESRLGRTITVQNCEQGCWLIVGEGHHPSWSATTAAGSLGEPELVAGGFNGWWIEPHDGPVTVWVGWTAQAPLNAAIAVSVAAAFATLVIALADGRGRRMRRTVAVDLPRFASPRSDGLRRSAVAAVAWVAMAGLFVDRDWAWWGLAGGVAVLVTRRIRVAALVAVGALIRIGVDVVMTVRRDRPPATPTFPLEFEDLHHLGLFAAVALAVSALARRRAPP